MISLICGILKITQMNTEQKQAHKHRKQTYSLPKGVREERRNFPS